MKLSLSLSVFLFRASLFLNAQVECDFNVYNRQGGLYYFATYFDGYGQDHPMEGVCQRTVNNTGKPYAYRFFKNGIMQDEVLYNIESGKPYQEFHRIDKDTLIAKSEYHNELDELTGRFTYFYNKEHKRCWKEETYQHNKLLTVKYFRSVRADELFEGHYTARPDHVVDVDDYTDIHIQFGPEIAYYPNGKINYIKHYKFVLTDSPYYYDFQDGKYQVFSEAGQLLTDGQYVDGKEDGVFHDYYLDGKKAGVRKYTLGVPTGKWTRWFQNGKVQSLEEYGEKYYWPTAKTIYYNEQGKVTYEKEILADGKGYEKMYDENGKLTTRKIFRYGPNNVAETHTYYPSGKIHERYYAEPHHDTIGVSYFENGAIQKLNMYHVDNDGTYTQRITEYLEPTQLLLKSVTKSHPQNGTEQEIEKYNRQGKLVYNLSLLNNETTETINWANGNLKRVTHRRDQLLNGWVMEKDSLGTTTFECAYKDGLRLGFCKLCPKPTTYPITAEELVAIELELLQNEYTNFYSQNSPGRLTQKELAKRARIVGQVIAYCKSMGFAYPLNGKVDFNHKFQYSADLPLSQYQGNKSKIDSVFEALSVTIDSKSEIGNYIEIKFTANELLYLVDFNEAFKNIFPANAGYFNPLFFDRNIEIDYGVKSRYQYKGLSIEALTNAFKVQISFGSFSRTFTIYPDNSIEFYNGIGDWNAKAETDPQNLLPWD